MSRLRRHRIGSSWEYSILAICDNGTATPLREVTVRSPTWPRSSRSDGTARATTSTFSMPSRTVVTGAPEISMLKRLRDVLRRQPERAGAVLVDHELEIGRLLVPVELRILDVGVLSDDVAHPVGDVAHGLGVGADHAELDGEADRRTEIEAVDAHPRLGQRAVVDRLLQPRLDALARLDVFGDDDDLGKGFVRQLRVEAEPEPRRALADIGGVGRDVLVVLQQRFRGLDRLLGDAERGAFGQAQLQEQFRPLGQREELLLHMAEADDRQREDADRRQHHLDAVVDAPLDHAAQHADRPGSHTPHADRDCG